MPADRGAGGVDGHSGRRRGCGCGCGRGGRRGRRRGRARRGRRRLVGHLRDQLDRRERRPRPLPDDDLGLLGDLEALAHGRDAAPGLGQADRGGEIDGDHPPAVLRIAAAEPAGDPLPELGGLEQHGEDRADRHDHRQAARALLAAATAVTAHITTTLTPQGACVQPLSRAEGAPLRESGADGRARTPTPRAHARTREARRGRQGPRRHEDAAAPLHRDRAGAADAQLRQRRAARPGQGPLDRRRLQPDLPRAGQARATSSASTPRARRSRASSRRPSTRRGTRRRPRTSRPRSRPSPTPTSSPSCSRRTRSSSRPSRSTRAGCSSTSCSASAR